MERLRLFVIINNTRSTTILYIDIKDFISYSYRYFAKNVKKQ
jgi:hypothetical protein